MTNAMEALFLYAQERMVRPLLDEEPEFYSVISCLERQESSLRALLDEETERRFQQFLEEQALFDLLNERAVFHAGFRLAIELTR